MSAIAIPSGPNVPRIIRSNTVPYKDGTTLVWYKKDEQDVANPRWKWWDGVVTSFADLEAWCAHVHIRGYVLTQKEEIDGVAAAARGTNVVESIFASDDILNARPIPFWEGLGVPIFNLTNLHVNYPYVGNAWDGTPDDATAMVALFYRFHRLAVGASDWKGSEGRGTGLLKIETAEPPQIWLLSQYFVHKVSKRAKEFRQCLKNNLQCPLLDKVVYLTETDLSSEWSSYRGKEKVVQEIIGERLTYKHMLQYTYEKIPDNVIVVFANADIYMNETLNELFTVNMRDKMFALLRYDEDAEGKLKLFGPHTSSQDTWIMLSDSVKARSWDFESFHYRLGIAGCDNRFAADIFSMKFSVTNPSQTIQTVHVHNTEIRDYDRKDILPARFYLFLNSTPLLTMDQVRHPPNKVAGGTFPPRQATVRLQCPTPKQAQTFSVMLGRFKRFVWDPATPTPYKSAARPLYKWTDSSVIGAGIVHDYCRTYIDSEIGGNYLQDATMPTYVDFKQHPTFTDRMLAIPCKRLDTLSNPDLYLVNYFTYAVQLQEMLRAQGIAPCSFFMPEAYVEIGKYFRVANLEELNVIKWTPTTTVHAKEVYGLLPEAVEWGTEDIRALRRSCKVPSAPKTKKRCVVLTDAVFAETRVKEQIGLILGESWEIVCVGPQQTGPAIYSQLGGADLCLFYNLPERPMSEWAKLWAVPAGCKVLEFQNELKVAGEFQHFAAACEFDTYLVPLHKAPVEDVWKQAFGEFEKWKVLHLKTE
jgi:hypothetical protein